jgi:hypothetical protein
MIPAESRPVVRPRRAAVEPAHSKPHGIKFLHLNLPASYRKTFRRPKNISYSTQHFDVQKASDLLAFRRAISGGLFRTPGRDVALATMDTANAAVAALPAKYRGRRRPRQWFAAERNVLAGEHSYDDAGEVPDRQSIANLELWWNGRLDVADAAHGVHPSSFSASVSPSGTSAVASSTIGAAAIIRCSSQRRKLFAPYCTRHRQCVPSSRSDAFEIIVGLAFY